MIVKKYKQIILGILFGTLLLSQSIEIPGKFINEDGLINIPIFIYEVEGLESIQLTIEYDDSIVLADNIIENPMGILDSGYIFITNLTDPGFIYLAITSNSTNEFSGSGMVAQITFQSIGNLGEFSELTFSDAQINSESVLGIAIDGSIEIVLDELTVTAVDQSGIGSDDFITLGMCETCTDGWRFGEDEYNNPNLSQDAYTDIYFFHLDWNGQTDVNNNTCNDVKFATDYRQQHSTTQLVSWGISGSTYDLSFDTPIILGWDSSKLSSSSDDFKMYIYVGDGDGVDMQGQNSITISQDDLSLDENLETNIKVLMGACAETNTTTYYQDFDGDGLGSDITAEYCSGYEPDGWVINSDDEDDYCFSNYHDCAGDCDGTAIEDECGECNGDDSSCADCAGVPNGDSWESDCGCVAADNSGDDCDDCAGEPYGSAVVDECGACGGSGIPEDECDCNGNIEDCAGVCGGDALVDECGECGGPGAYYCGGGIYECNEIDCPDTIDYCLDLHLGANLISFYALPDSSTIGNVMSSIDGFVTGVIGEGVAASPHPVLGWVGSIANIDILSGYWVIVDDDCSLCINDALLTDPETEYNLHSGANLISFPSEDTVTVGYALPDDIEFYVTGIITEGGASTQIDGEWLGSLTAFSGGEGYWMITSENISFSFDFTDLERQKIDSVAGLTYPAEFEINQSTSQAFYFADNIKIDNESINDGWILAYHGNTLVGARQWTGEMIDIPVMGNDGNAYSKGYIKPGEIPRFMHFNEYNGEMTDLYSNNTPEWGNNAIFMMGALEERNVLPEKISLSAYPNPFNPVTTLSFAMPNEGMVQLSIYNVSGQLMAKLAHEYRTAGNVEYIWDAGTHPSGVYVARLNIENTIHTQKLVLMK